jgi:hypothetical protein
MKFHAHLFKRAFSGAQMFADAVAAERDHVRVLANQEHVGNCAGFARLDELLLQFARRAVGDQPLVYHPAGFFWLYQSSLEITAF